MIGPAEICQLRRIRFVRARLHTMLAWRTEAVETCSTVRDYALIARVGRGGRGDGGRCERARIVAQL